jgi:hypothetical protein
MKPGQTEKSDGGKGAVRPERLIGHCCGSEYAHDNEK